MKDLEIKDKPLQNYKLVTRLIVTQSVKRTGSLKRLYKTRKLTLHASLGGLFPKNIYKRGRKS